MPVKEVQKLENPPEWKRTAGFWVPAAMISCKQAEIFKRRNA